VDVAGKLGRMSGNVQCGEQLVLWCQLRRASQRLDKRSLAAVGISDNGHARHMKPVTIFPKDCALIRHRGNLLFKFALSPDRNTQKTIFNRIVSFQEDER